MLEIREQFKEIRAYFRSNPLNMLFCRKIIVVV